MEGNWNRGMLLRANSFIKKQHCPNSKPGPQDNGDSQRSSKPLQQASQSIFSSVLEKNF
jgi:hypothetical protein